MLLILSFVHLVHTEQDYYLCLGILAAKLNPNQPPRTGAVPSQGIKSGLRTRWAHDKSIPLLSVLPEKHTATCQCVDNNNPSPAVHKKRNAPVKTHMIWIPTSSILEYEAKSLHNTQNKRQTSRKVSAAQSASKQSLPPPGYPTNLFLREPIQAGASGLPLATTPTDCCMNTIRNSLSPRNQVDTGPCAQQKTLPLSVLEKKHTTYNVGSHNNPNKCLQ